MPQRKTLADPIFQWRGQICCVQVTSPPNHGLETRVEIVEDVMPLRGQLGLHLNLYLQPVYWDEDLEG